jgi:cell division protein FtsB
MDIVRSVKRGLLAALWPTALMGATVYFGWYGLNGAHGQKAVPQREAALEAAKADLAKAQAERDGWEQKVASLKTAHLDPDMLDERSRTVLNMAKPDEIVVPYPKDKPLYANSGG